MNIIVTVINTHNKFQIRTYPFTYSISTANNWEQKAITIAGDTSGTWLTTNGAGLAVQFGLGIDASISGTAGSWAGTGYWGATGAINLLATSGATFYITGVQLEEGSVATPFETRQYGQELALCQRYFEVAYVTSSNYAFLSSSYLGTTNNWYSYYYKVPKRAVATFNLTNGTWNGSPTIYAHIDQTMFYGGSTFLLQGTAGQSACSFSAEL